MHMGASWALVWRWGDPTPSDSLSRTVPSEDNPLLLLVVQPANGICESGVSIRCRRRWKRVENTRRPALFLESGEHEFLHRAGLAELFDEYRA